jgi:hypothetical protein
MAKCTGASITKTRKLFGMCVPRGLPEKDADTWNTVASFLRENSQLYMFLVNL